MKKFLSVILCAVFLLTLCSCGGKPRNMSDAMYQIGLNALSVADQYIAGEITGDEAYSRLEEYNTQATAQTNQEERDLGVPSLYRSKYEGDAFVNTDILSLYAAVGYVKRGIGTMSEVKELRDDLAKALGE